MGCLIFLDLPLLTTEEQFSVALAVSTFYYRLLSYFYLFLSKQIRIYLPTISLVYVSCDLRAESDTNSKDGISRRYDLRNSGAPDANSLAALRSR